MTQRRLTITQTHEFDTGHRLMCHEGKCKNAHGHRYKVEIEVSALAIQADGMVTDFTNLKRTIGDWIDENWDHGFIAQVTDPLIKVLREQGLKVYVVSQPPTAENLVEVLACTAETLLAKLDPTLRLESVRWYETPRCWATWKREASAIAALPPVG